MPTLGGIAHRLRTLVSRRAADSETLEELADHLERQTRKHIEAGMSEGDAARLARIELGGVQRWHEETAEARTSWPAVYGASAVLLVVAIAAAALLPLRTMRADPRDAMRAD
jgi:hypothetical protein